MAEVARRRVRLVVGEWQIEDLEVGFNVVQTTTATSNSAQFEVYNLGREKLAQAQTLDRFTPVDFSAGYGDKLDLIYRGLLDYVEIEQQNQDVIARFVGRSGLRAKSMATQFNESFKAGTPVRQVLELLRESLGVGQGNLPEFLDRFDTGGAGRSFANGAAFAGPAWDSLKGLVEQAGYTVSIVNEELVIVGLDGSLNKAAIRLSPETGLIGTPALALETGDGGGRVRTLRAQTIMIPGLTPGRQLQVDSQYVTGAFRVTRSTYRGAWQSGEFGCDIEARRL